MIQAFYILYISSPDSICPDTGLITYVQALTVQIKFDLRSGSRFGDATAPCLWRVTDVLKLKTHWAEVQSCFVHAR